MAATNSIAINVYKINQQADIAVSTAGYNPLYFPSTGLLVQPVGTSDANPLKTTGVYVYSAISIGGQGAIYYSGLTPTQVAALANA